jgi:tripartite-type tricarboxylate transporter receptor subunit TctC
VNQFEGDGSRNALLTETVVLRRVAALCLAFVIQTAAHAETGAVEDFYRGKVITVIVGVGPGGGFDVIARLLARHLGKYIPGNPTVIVQNMPGAGTLVAANYLYNVAPKDGTQFGLIARNMPLIGLLGDNQNVRFDPRKYTWLGSSSDFSDDAYVMLVRKDAPVKSIGDARRPGGPTLVMGGTAEGASSADVPKIIRDALGLNMKLILGYRDSAALFLAMENGEVMGRMVELSSVRSTRPQWLKPQSDYRMLAMYARAKRDPEFPDIPTARETSSSSRKRRCSPWRGRSLRPRASRRIAPWRCRRPSPPPIGIAIIWRKQKRSASRSIRSARPTYTWPSTSSPAHRRAFSTTYGN